MKGQRHCVRKKNTPGGQRCAKYAPGPKPTMMGGDLGDLGDFGMTTEYIPGKGLRCRRDDGKFMSCPVSLLSGEIGEIGEIGDLGDLGRTKKRRKTTRRKSPARKSGGRVARRIRTPGGVRCQNTKGKFIKCP